MSNPFCRLFETSTHGQILVKLDRNDEGIPEVRYYMQPPNLGVCSVALSFSDDDEGWDLAENAFAKSDERYCVEKVVPIISKL